MRRIWILGLCGVLLGWQNMNMNVAPATAALPPLSKDRLMNDSSHIIIAKVRAISRVEVPAQFGTNYFYTATVEVLKIDKAPKSQSLPQISSGKVIEVQYWQAGKSQVPGPGGQRPGLEAGTTVRLFLKQDEEKKLHLLDPNGSELLPTN